MTNNMQNRRVRCDEEGYILVWVMFMLFIFTLWLSVAIPKAAKEIQLDRERETMNRGKQYIRAVQLYYRKFHAYPPSANALVNTNEIRFLRKKYKDPITGKDDWKPIRYGQNKTPTAIGFFGQPLAGNASTIAGTGPGGNGGLGGSATGSQIGNSSLGGSTFGGSSIFSSGSSGGSSTGSSTGSGTSTASGTSGSGSSASKTDSSTSSDSSNQTFGGAGIVGFEPASTATSILLYKQKQHYNEWEFVYDPLTDVKTQAGNTGAIGQPAGSTTTPIGGSSSSSDSGNSSGSGSSSSSGSDSNSNSGSSPNNPPQQ